MPEYSELESILQDIQGGKQLRQFSEREIYVLRQRFGDTFAEDLGLVTKFMHYAKGDLFANVPDNTIIAHVCNTKHVWSGGFVLAVSRHYPQAEEVYRAEESLELGEIQFVPIDTKRRIAVVNMIAQQLVGNVPLRYSALGACLHELYRIVHTKQQIYMPKIGAGLACGDWTFIHRMIEECAEYYGVNTTIFEL